MDLYLHPAYALWNTDSLTVALETRLGSFFFSDSLFSFLSSFVYFIARYSLTLRATLLSFGLHFTSVFFRLCFLKPCIVSLPIFLYCVYLLCFCRMYFSIFLILFLCSCPFLVLLFLSFVLCFSFPLCRIVASLICLCFFVAIQGTASLS